MKNKFLNIFFIIEAVLFGLIITGILPRETALYLGAALVLYVLAAPLDDSLVFFVGSIPLFLALPITDSFDNFNTWRMLTAIIFLKWLWPQIFNFQLLKFKSLKLITYNVKPFVLTLLILFILAVLSVIPASDKIVAIKRIIFFLNFAIFGIVLYYKAANKEFAKRLIRNSIIPVIIVAAVGYIQVISTYFIDIYQFMRIWGEGIQCRQFGEQWCNIAVQLGNTWFAYYGEQLSLRVFSLFPDSHSFPQFVLLGIPAILATMLREIRNPKFEILNSRFQTFSILALLFLIVILSGTRGIWVAGIGVILLALGIIVHTKREMVITKFAVANFVIFKNLTKHLIIFFMMFAIAFPIFSSPQFLVGKSADMLKQRIKSIIDFGETSNAQRIEIWKKTLVSIKKRPLLGVGAGNYPVVLGQDIRLAKAGSSAHNLYLHVFAEMGVAAGIIFLWFLWLLFRENYKIFRNEKDKFLLTYFAATLLFVPWVLIYSLTDIAILDERALLFAVVPVAIIFGFNPRD